MPRRSSDAISLGLAARHPGPSRRLRSALRRARQRHRPGVPVPRAEGVAAEARVEGEASMASLGWPGRQRVRACQPVGDEAAARRHLRLVDECVTQELCPGLEFIDRGHGGGALGARGPAQADPALGEPSFVGRGTMKQLSVEDSDGRLRGSRGHHGDEPGMGARPAVVADQPRRITGRGRVGMLEECRSEQRPRWVDGVSARAP